MNNWVINKCIQKHAYDMGIIIDELINLCN